PANCLRFQSKMGASGWQTASLIMNALKDMKELDVRVQLAKSKNGIMVQIYSAFIFYLLVMIMTAAAESTNKKITEVLFLYFCPFKVC
ncbi:MAG: hypothetical protein N2V72_08845, partial [Methanophagales archaeon]|nr:hypothetical protein [Methanophagales archaeon]